MRPSEYRATGEGLPAHVRVLCGLLSLCVTYLALHEMKIDALWKKMMVVEARWFASSVFVIMAASFLGFVVVRKHIFRNPLTSASVGALMGLIAGTIASVIAGYVRGGVFFRLTALASHPLDQVVSVFMTATWLLGIVAFLALHLIWVVAQKVFFSKKTLSSKPSSR